jgi:hypothetical protein
MHIYAKKEASDEASLFFDLITGNLIDSTVSDRIIFTMVSKIRYPGWHYQ